MDINDKIENAADDAAGKAKDVAGDVTGDRSLQAEGKIDQASADLKQGAQNAADTAADLADTATSSRGPIHLLHSVGAKSEWAYIAGFASIGISLTSWFLSRKKVGDSKAQSDRWGIFIGHWAPTFMALGVALKLEER